MELQNCAVHFQERREKAGWNETRVRPGLACFAVTTLLATALNAAADLLAHFLDEKRRAASRTGFVNRAIPQGIFARRIFTASEERSSFSCTLLDEISATAWLGTLHAQ